MRRNSFWPVFLATLVLFPATVWAGMPSISISKIGALRLQELSFFLFVFLMAAWGVQVLWNFLAREIPRFPEIGYRRSLAFMGLWGLLFVVVLTMISGARELMTPRAWELKPNGWTHQLAKNDERHDRRGSDSLFVNRVVAITKLHGELIRYAEKHNGVFPESLDLLDDKAGEIPGQFGLPYVYLAGDESGGGVRPLVHEPLGLDDTFLVALVDGRVLDVTEAEFEKLCWAIEVQE